MNQRGDNHDRHEFACHSDKRYSTCERKVRVREEEMCVRERIDTRLLGRDHGDYLGGGEGGVLLLLTPLRLKK